MTAVNTHTPARMKWTICGILFLSYYASGHLFSAVSELEGLIKTEERILQIMESYIDEIHDKIDSFKRDLLKYKHEHLMAVKDIEEYLDNPINAYMLIKRVLIDWKTMEQNMSFDEVAQDSLSELNDIRSTMPYPKIEDLTGAARSLMRLQDTYKLETASLAKGYINGIQYSTHLSVRDCYDFGMFAYGNDDFHHTGIWMNETIVLLEGKLNSTGVNRWEALELLAYSLYMQGHIKGALDVTEELLKIYPDHKGAITNKAIYIESIKNSSKVQNHLINKISAPLTPTENDLYEMTCRNAISPNHNIEAKLSCRYANNNPFLRLAPIKEEQAYRNPNIILFRNALSDVEIKAIKNIAQKRLKDAAVENATNGDSVIFQDIRLSKFGWLTPGDGEWYDKILKRVEDMTSLSTETAETMQVVNYGIGGHYIVHEDYAKIATSKVTSFGTGNRIATVLFYLSDVPQGDATVFPNLHVTIKPEKGTALFWLNLHPDGQGDPLSRHAACPVLIGSKWVATFWLHERGQEFRRPCGLFQNTPVELMQSSEVVITK